MAIRDAMLPEFDHEMGKLSKADGASGIRELRAAGRRAPDVIGEAAAAIGLIDTPLPIEAAEVATLFPAPASD